LSVTVHQAEELTNGLSQGSLSVSLRGYADTELIPATPRSAALIVTPPRDGVAHFPAPGIEQLKVKK
jgi:hypothetical protein